MIAYLVRHGSTDISGPEGWLSVSLNREGQKQMVAAADFLSQYAREHPRPDWIVSSDLPRSEQSAAILGEFVHIGKIRHLKDLRAFDKKHETPDDFEKRSGPAFEKIFTYAEASGTLPLIVCHSSQIGYLAKLCGVLAKPNYENVNLILNGGVIALSDNHMEPLFRFIEANWPEVHKCQS